MLDTIIKMREVMGDGMMQMRQAEASPGFSVALANSAH